MIHMIEEIIERNLRIRGNFVSLIFNSNRYIQIKLFTVMIISKFKKYIFSSIYKILVINKIILLKIFI